MAIRLANLALDRTIVHQVLLTSDLDGGQQPQVSDVFVQLDPKGEALLCKRIADALGSDSHSVELDVEHDGEGSAFDIATKLLDATDGDFKTLSADLAMMLTRAQNVGAIKAGIAVIIRGTCGSNSSAKRFVALLKAEPDEGFVAEQGATAVFLKFVSDLVLGAQQRLFKIDCLIETAKPNADSTSPRDKKHFEVVVYDHQMSNSGSNNAARYFYQTFLGCRLADNARRQTRIFFEETTKFINSLKLSAKERVEAQTHLVSYLKSEQPTISVREYAERYLLKEHRTGYMKIMRKAFPPRAVSKDIKDIRRKLQVRHMVFDSKVKITAPEDEFDDLVKIERATSDYTLVQIKGSLERQT
jgi:hypothetical protein